MKTRALFTLNALFLSLLVFNSTADAQEQEVPKLEIGVQYSPLSINLPVFGGTETALGFGGRVTYNFNNYFAVEAEGNLFPSDLSSRYTTGGASEQLQAGLKAGKRWKRFGLFAKARPGLVSFGDTVRPELVTISGTTVTQFQHERKTHFSMDVGGVLEFYPSRRMLVRFDAGDTIIRYGAHDESFFGTSPSVFRVGPEVQHNFQFTGGIGFRFGEGSGDGDSSPGPFAAGERVRRFEAGIQFSSLALRLPSDGSRFTDRGSGTEAGGGLRFGVNATNDLAFEVEGNFYPRKRYGIDTAVGGYPSQLQAGVKYGRRFERFGVFGKARPGLVHFSRVEEVTGYDPVVFGSQTFFFPNFRSVSKTYFSMDLGGVFEFYPSKRLLTRFDVGDTMIHYPDRDNPTTFTGTPPLRLPAELRHNLQVTAGLGFRF
ncbi:MAG: outer membrane beta-barrel protein [Acidobacteria bacterium]|nr:outer membrane beta-barrel protein [Acidobacteriota bacterium]